MLLSIGITFADPLGGCRIVADDLRRPETENRIRQGLSSVGDVKIRLVRRQRNRRAGSVSSLSPSA